MLLKTPRAINVLKYSHAGCHYFYDLESGLFAESSPLLNDLFDMIPGYTNNEIIETLNKKYEKSDIEAYLEEINSMAEQKVLFFNYLQEARKAAPVQGLSHLWLNVSHDCNMRCHYCYAQGGNYGGSRVNMSRETAKRCIDFWFKNLNAGRKSVINFFGGEPFMNREVIVFCIHYVKALCGDSERDISFSMTTNGTFFDEDFATTLANNKVELLFSVDGISSVQNKNRPLASGEDSYERVKSNIRKFAQYFKTLRATMVITKESVPFIYESVLDLWEMGFNSVACSPAIAADPAIAIDEKGLELLYEQIIKLNEITYRNILNRTYKLFINSFRYCLYIHNRLLDTECSIQSESAVIFTPEGHMHKCHRFIDEPQFTIGQVDETLSWRDINKSFIKDELRQVCEKCWAFRLCGGACLHESFVNYGDTSKPYEITCLYKKFLIKEAFKLYANLYSNAPNIINEVFTFFNGSKRL